MSKPEFSALSQKINKSLSKEERKKQGIFFTPGKARKALFDNLNSLGVQPKKIIEPSFGTGEFILDAQRLYPNACIEGIEQNELLYIETKKLDIQPTTTLIHSDFLTYKGTSDLIIGNPPYFVMETTQKFPCMKSRPNIFVLFLYKCLTEHLEPDGYLAFIIPTSIYNCSYYQPMRDYIQQYTTIHHLETLNKPGFYETGQETTLLILQKTKQHDHYIFKTTHIYLSPFYKELYHITKKTTTIKDLGLSVKTGNVVWNQHKSKLADTGTLLVYSSNINNSTLVIDNLNPPKKQYINIDKPPLNGPVILVERGYGNSFKFNSVFVDRSNFYAENHINVIYAKDKEFEKNLERVFQSFQDERTQLFIKYFLGNGSMTATDLETLLPIF